MLGRYLKAALLSLTMLGAGFAQAETISSTENFSDGSHSDFFEQTNGSANMYGEALRPINRDIFRTSTQYFATESAPISFGMTVSFLYDDIAVISLRAADTDNLYDYWHEPLNSVYLRVHSFQGGHNGVSYNTNLDDTYEQHNPDSGESFYDSPVRIEVIDYGTRIDVSMTNLVTNEMNNFSYETDYSAGGYYGVVGDGGAVYDDVTFTQSESLVSNVSAPLMVSILGLVVIGLGRRKSSY